MSKKSLDTSGIRTLYCACMQDILTRRRELKKLKQVELARLAGISEALLSRLEAGKIKRPSWETVSRLAAVLGMRPEKLFPRDGGAS